MMVDPWVLAAWTAFVGICMFLAGKALTLASPDYGCDLEPVRENWMPEGYRHALSHEEPSNEELAEMFNALLEGRSIEPWRAAYNPHDGQIYLFIRDDAGACRSA